MLKPKEDGEYNAAAEEVDVEEDVEQLLAADVQQVHQQVYSELLNDVADSDYDSEFEDIEDMCADLSDGEDAFEDDDGLV